MISISTLLFIFLASNPWVGVWRILPKKAPQKGLHLIVRTLEEVELYDSEWYPYKILQAKLEMDSLELQVVGASRARPFTLVGKRDGTRLAVASWFSIPQLLGNVKKMNGLKVLEDTIRPPVEFISQYREKHRIDILTYLLEKAPRQDFYKFIHFWDQDFEKRFYLFLEMALYGDHNNPTQKQELLRQLFENLENYKKEDVQATIRGQIKHLSKQSTPAKLLRSQPNRRPHPVTPSSSSKGWVVILPQLGETRKTVRRLHSVETDIPLSELCCGAQPLPERFLILPVHPRGEKPDPVNQPQTK